VSERDGRRIRRDNGELGSPPATRIPPVRAPAATACSQPPCIAIIPAASTQADPFGEKRRGAEAACRRDAALLTGAVPSPARRAAAWRYTEQPLVHFFACHRY
jgi:hypothetical protein